MIVTIDGPAGAGKSTVARALARRLGFRYLDTGAMYRAVALAGLRSGVDWDRPAIRSTEVTAATRFAADNPLVRQGMVQLQREVAAHGDLVSEGRDQGSVVFPEAECKIFLTASAEERARRRVSDFRVRGESRTFESVLADLRRRDQEDAGRPVGPLVRPDQAVEVCTDGMSVRQVVDRLETVVHRRRPRRQ